MDSVLLNVISNFSDAVVFGIVIVLLSFKVNITLSSVSSTSLKMPPACPAPPLLAFIVRCLAELCPRCSVIGDIPVSALDFQLRRYAVFSILSGLAILLVLAIFAGVSVLPIVAVLSRFTILTVAAFCFYLFAGIIRQPVAVKRPVIDSVGILLYSDNRGRAVFPVFAGFAVLTVFSILSVVNRNRCALGKGNGVTNCFSVLGNGDTPVM